MLAQPEYCFHKLPLNWISRHLAIKSLVADQLLFVFLHRKTLQKDLFLLTNGKILFTARKYFQSWEPALGYLDTRNLNLSCHSIFLEGGGGGGEKEERRRGRKKKIIPTVTFRSLLVPPPPPTL